MKITCSRCSHVFFSDIEYQNCYDCRIKILKTLGYTYKKMFRELVQMEKQIDWLLEKNLYQIEATEGEDHFFLLGEMDNTIKYLRNIRKKLITFGNWQGTNKNGLTRDDIAYYNTHIYKWTNSF